MSLRISVVTPAYNMAAYVEETVRSVLPQKEAFDEYIVIDGASTDGTIEKLRDFGDKINTLVSEPDDGQYHAIVKGMALATGDINCWINADDILMPWTFRVVRQIFSEFPDVDWITGLPSFLDDRGVLTTSHRKIASYPRRFIRNGWYRRDLGGYLQQESMFWRRSLWEKVGGLDTSLSLAADFNLWRRFAEHAELVPVSVPLAAFRERVGLQRSSRLAVGYEDEVERDTAPLPPPPLIWRAFSRGGVIGRSLARATTYRLGSAIIFSREQRKWKMVNRLRSLSRLSTSDLVDEYLARLA